MDKKLSKEEYVMHLARKSNVISMSNGNSKTGACCNNLAFPTSTCREDAPCKTTGCYCMKGTQQFSNVLAAYTRNFLIYKENPNDFWTQVRDRLRRKPLPLFRWFDAGDIPDYQFFCGMVDLAKTFEDIKFMSFTKKYHIVNEWIAENGELPDNLNIIFSAWDKDWEVSNPHSLPVAYVDFSDSDLNPTFPDGITGCPAQRDKYITCSMCKKCWNKKSTSRKI